MFSLAKATFLLLVFSLPFAKHGVIIGGLLATATDFLYLVTVAALGSRS